MTNAPEIALAPVTKVNVPEGEYHTVVWVNDRLVIQYQPDPDDAFRYSVRLGWVEPTGSDLQMLELPKHPGCGPDGLNGFFAPERLPDGRLGYVVKCRPKDDIRGIRLHMMALDMHTGQIEQLLDTSFPTEFVGTGGYAWNPEMNRGITGEGRGAYIAEELYWFTRDSWERVDLDFAQSYGPSWSPDGETIAFVAAEEEGSPRTFTSYDIFLMGADGQKIRRMVRGTWATPGTAFSPDGQWLAFPASFDRDRADEDRGLYLLHVDSGELFMIAKAGQYGFSVPSWSPDGERIVVANDISPEFDQTVKEILIIEVGEILGELAP